MQPGEKEMPPKVSEEISIGQTITVRAFMGRAGNVVGRLADGRIILFNKESQHLANIEPGTLIDARVVYVAKNYIIVDPIATPEGGIESLKKSLRALMEIEDWEMAVLAKSLLYIIEKLEKE